MFIHRNKKCIKTKRGEKVYRSVLLLESYREGKKIKHRTIANLSEWPPGLVVSFEKLLKGETFQSIEELETEQGKSCGALITIYPLQEAPH